MKHLLRNIYSASSPPALVVGEDQLLLPWLNVARPTGLQTPGVAPEYFIDVLVVTDAPLYTAYVKLCTVLYVVFDVIQ